MRATELALDRKTTHQELAAAIIQLRERARVFRRQGLRNQAAADYLSLGEIYFIWGRYQQALGMYRRALLLSTKQAIDLKCSILSHIAIGYATFASPAESLRYSREALGLSENAGSLTQAEANEALGLGLLYSNDSDQALDVLHSSEETFKALGDENGQARTGFYSGVVLLQAGFASQALEVENKALQLWMATGNLHGAAEAYVGLGVLHSTVGEPDQALAEFQHAREIFRNLGDRANEGVVLNGLGVINSELGNYEAALGYHKQAREIFISAGDRLGELAAIDSIAKDEWSLHRYSEARLLYTSELKRARQLKTYREEAAAFSDLGDIYLYEEKYRQAELFYKRSLSAYKRAKYIAGEADILTRFGRLCARTKRYGEALTYFNLAIVRAKAAKEVVKEAEAHYELADTHRLSGQFELAKAESEKALGIIESERVKVSDFGSRATYFASVHEYYQLYIEVLMQLHDQHPDQGFAAMALEASERSKVRSLLDMLASSSQKSGCDGSNTPMQESPDQKPSSMGCNVAPAALTAQQIQAAIQGDDAVLLEYALGPRASYLWVVDEGRISSYRLPGAQQILDITTRFRNALLARQMRAQEGADHYNQRVGRADSTMRSIAQELSQLLLGPAAGLLTKKRIIIIPDGPLQYIPFAALPFPALPAARSSRLLADTYELTSLPSASVLSVLRDAATRRTPPTKLAAVFADPVFSRDDPRLGQSLLANAAPSQPSPTLGAALRDAQIGSGKIPRLASSGAEAKNIAGIFANQD
ncbi:MAG TPA: tetratricopeptide repeat protein, partial [Candidatus Angelobacter sp.]